MSNRGILYTLLASIVVVVLAILCAPRAFAAGTDIVLYAADARNVNGHWSISADASAAGGQAIVSSDTGWASANAGGCLLVYSSCSVVAQASTTVFDEQWR